MASAGWREGSDQPFILPAAAVGNQNFLAITAWRICVRFRAKRELISMTPNKTQPWYRTHVVTVIATAIMALVLFVANYRLNRGLTSGGLWHMTTNYSQGWPATFRIVYVDEFGPFDRAGRASTTTTEVDWYIGALLSNLTIATLLVAATAVVCEVKCRDSLPWWQLSLRSMLILVAVVSCLLVLHQNDHGLHGLPSRVGTGWLSTTPWHLKLPIMAALGCFIYLMGWLVVTGIVEGARRVRSVVLST